MEKKFILVLTEHRTTGYVFVPYIAELQGNSDYFLLVERIILDDIRKRPSDFTDDQKKLVKLIEEYSDNELTRAFSKKKMTNQEFISGLTAEMLANQVRPYIERRLLRIIDVLRTSSIEVFFKDAHRQVYCSEKVIIDPNPAEGVFNFIRTPTELKYFLSVSHKNREMKLTNLPGIILVNEPCHLVVNNKILVFNDIDGKKLSPFFRHEFVIVPKAREKDYLEKFVLNTIKKFRVKCSGFTIVEDAPTPSKVLALEGDLQYNPVLRLYFDYGNGKKINAGQVIEDSVTLQTDGDNYTFYKTARNANFERKSVDSLKSLGLKNDGTAFFKIDFVPGDTMEEMLGDLVNWININESVLSKEGFSIVQEFFDKQFYTQNIDLQTSFNQKEDWFDVYAEVVLGEFRIPFIRFKKHILSNNREFKLPNGEVVILPKEWFAHYSDLFYFGKTEGEHLMFRSVHMPVLQESFKSFNKDYLTPLLELYEASKTGHTPSLPDVNATLRPYQTEGFAWMYWLSQNNLGACLADDMGLGKTLQTLTLLKKVIEKYPANNNSENAPATLVVLPASLVHNWYNEIQKFTPEFKALKYIGTNRSLSLEELNNYQIVLTTYGVVRNEYEQLKEYEFLYIILDESQTIKNPDSKIFQAVTELRSKNRLVLTGTPIENSLTDLWSQIEFLNPGILGDVNFFRQYFAYPIEREGDEAKRDKLKNLIHPFILRRTKQEVATDLPPLTEQIRLCSMSDSQKAYYEEEKSKVRNEILNSIDQVGVEKSTMMVLNALIRLRQIANHPFMVDPRYTDDSGKFEEIADSLENMYQEGHKVLIFSSFVKHLELFRTYFEVKGWKYSILTGETRKREEVVRDFQTQPDHRFFLISLKAGGVGLNLTAADYVFLLDPWWNPAAEMQAINRAHRIGQTNKVFVYRFITAETIEEKIIKLQERKTQLAENFINSNNPFKGLSKESILELFE
ncbi:MAG: DEAD/DEAH box helicase [Bacteroidota bacterium]|nr:DEAD/DEAH box helicase [Bacteroidota bacterium]